MQDCFVDCDGSHWSARFVLLEAWIEVRKRLFGRKLHAPLRSVYRAISDVGGWWAVGQRVIMRADTGQRQLGSRGCLQLREDCQNCNPASPALTIGCGLAYPHPPCSGVPG